MNWFRTQPEQPDSLATDESLPPQRKYTRRQIAGYTVSALASLTAVESNSAAARISVTRHQVRMHHLTERLRVVQITDLHRSPFVSENFIGHVVAAANAEKPDLMVLTGDFVTGASSYAESCMRQLAALKAPMGKYAVLGNHDYWCDGGFGGPFIADALEQTEIEVVTNRSVKLKSGLRIVGIDDLMGGVPDYSMSFANIGSSEPVLALSHNPGAFNIVCRKDCLVLSGHTHGGQLYVAGLTNWLLGSTYLRGWYEYPEFPGRMYISRGLGTIHVPMRICSAPELAVFDLEPA